MLKHNPLEKLFDTLLILETIKYNECYFFSHKYYLLEEQK